MALAGWLAGERFVVAGCWLAAAAALLALRLRGALYRTQTCCQAGRALLASWHSSRQRSLRLRRSPARRLAKPPDMHIRRLLGGGRFYKLGLLLPLWLRLLLLLLFRLAVEERQPASLLLTPLTGVRPAAMRRQPTAASASFSLIAVAPAPRCWRPSETGNRPVPLNGVQFGWCASRRGNLCAATPLVPFRRRFVRAVSAIHSSSRATLIGRVHFPLSSFRKRASQSEPGELGDYGAPAGP